MTARFTKRLKLNEPIEKLILAISMGNDKQTAEYLNDFIDLINRHNTPEIKIKQVDILLSCYLQRHYIGKEAAIKRGKNWILENEKYLKNLEHEVKYKIIPWIDFNATAEFQLIYSEVDLLYKKNSEFKTIIDNLVKRHAPKADVVSAKNYLFEECTVFRLLKNSHVSYPSNQLNAAVEFVTKYFNTNISYHGYAFYNKPSDNKLLCRNQKEKISTKKKLSSSEEKAIEEEIIKISKKLHDYGFNSKAQQTFFKQVIQKISSGTKTDIPSSANEPYYQYKAQI